MLVFLLILLPLAFSYYCFLRKDKQIVFPAIAGLLVSIIFCACKNFFTFSHRVVPYSFTENFGYFVFKNILLITFLIAFYILISRDTLDFKLSTLFPYLCGFFIVYLPFSVIAENESVVYSGFDIFVKPFICLFMLMEFQSCANFLKNGITEKNILKIIVSVIVAIIYLVVPCIIFAMYITGLSSILVLLISILYCIVPLFSFVIHLVVEK